MIATLKGTSVLLPILFRSFRIVRWACVLTGFICSCSIEILQHITQTGFLQLDDVVTNTMGTLLGWFICRAWKVDRKYDHDGNHLPMYQGMSDKSSTSTVRREYANNITYHGGRNRQPIWNRNKTVGAGR